MTEADRYADGDQNSPEPSTTVTLKYTPAGHREQLARLGRAWQEAVFAAERLAHTVPEDVRGVIASSVIDGIEVAKNDPTGSVADYRSAVELNHNYRQAVASEREIADDFLMRLAEPLIAEPPRDQWGIAGVITPKGVEAQRVPFTQSEIDAIYAAREARKVLVGWGHLHGSGVERDFWSESQFFPDEVKRGPFSQGLNNRPSAVWGIMTAARAAEKALTLHVGTAEEPRGPIVGVFTTVRDLPDKLIRHKPPVTK